MKKPYAVLLPVFLSFLLGVHDGKLALWKGNDPEPVYQFPYSASLFPEEDQDALRHGIRVEDSELIRILEDFCS